MIEAVLPAMGTGAPANRRVPVQFRVALRRCFGTPWNGAITIAMLALLLLAGSYAVRFAVLDAVFAADTPAACRAAAGACWATVVQHGRVLFFGLYPMEQQWRAALAIAFTLLCAAAAFLPVVQRPKRLAALLVACWAGIAVLLGGGVAGLARVPTEQWSGLPLTLYVFLSTVVVGFPAAILLALARTSRLPVIRGAASLLVQTVRSVPLLAILFTAAVVVPVMVPDALSPAKTGRIIVALALFYGCYQAEVIRGGMLAVPPTERESAAALGLGAWQITTLIVLPQALRLTIPATVNLMVVAFKDTSLIVVVGLLDFLAAANMSIASDAWAPFFGEVYFIIAATYLVFAACLSVLGRVAERRLQVLR